MTEDPGMRPNLAGFVYIGALAAVSSVSMLRILVVAGGMSKPDFAEYAAIVALGSYLGGILSFGKVEATIKSFPRFAASGQIKKIRHETRALMLILARRALIISVPLIGLGYLFSARPILTLGAGVLYAFGVGCFAILASAQRALSQPKLLLAGTAFRTFCAFAVVTFMVVFTHVPLWILLGVECLTMVVSSLISEAVIFKNIGLLTAKEQPIDHEPGTAMRAADSGLTIFFAFSLIAAPSYLDRFFANLIFDTNDAARYAVFGIFLLMISLLVNTICQRVGPDIIKMVSNLTTRYQILRYMCVWSAISIVIWGIFLLTIILAFKFEIIPEDLLKFNIALQDLLPIFFLGAASVSSIFEFYMMAVDKERQWLQVILLYVSAVFLVFLAADVYSLPLNSFMWLLAGSRFLYLAMLFYVAIFQMDEASST